ncbi:MAG: YhfC family glutamic-type intramembrane protease [Thermoguttaceae bacterium]|jgi:hypothetical protein
MRFVMRLKFSLILVALAAIALVSQSLAEPPDSPAPAQFSGLPVTITAPRDSSRSIFLRLRMEEGQCKVSRETPDGRHVDLFAMGEGTWSGKLTLGETIRLDPQGHRGEYYVRLDPETPANLLVYFPSSLGMMLVGAVAVIYWKRTSHACFCWFWIGAGLWTVAVAVKVVCALASNAAVIGFLKHNLPYPLLVACGGLFLGIESSLCEMGFTLLAVWIWRQLGREAGRAIAVGVGAGAFEAFLLGAGALVTALVAIAGLPAAEQIGQELSKAAATTPLFWLIGPTERIIAILCHASSRALILLGVANRRFAMVFWGFVIFTSIDGIAGAAHVSGKLGTFSVWWIELAILPFALISVPILRWCYRHWNERAADLGLEKAVVA